MQRLQFGFISWAALAFAVLVTPAAGVDAPAADLLIEQIDLNGELPFPEKKARRILDLKVGGVFTPDAAQSASNRLMEACRNEAYPLARVGWRGIPLAEADQLRLAFNVEIGPQGRLESLIIEGNESIPSDTIREVLTVRPMSGAWNRITGRDLLLLEDLGADQEALYNLYVDQGFYDVEIGAPDLQWSETLGGFTLVWPILNEGPQYRIGTVSTEGEPPRLPVPESLGLRTGTIAGAGTLRAATEALREALLERGYGFSSVELEPDWKSDDATVDLVYQIEPGRIVTLREVRLQGEFKTRERLLMREIFLRPGETFNPQALRLSEEALLSLGIFEEIEMKITGGPDQDEFDLDILLKEAPTGRVEGGLTWGSVEGPAVLIGVSDRNFSLKPPFRGDLLEAELSFLIGTEIARTEAGLINPRLGDSYWALGGDVFYEYNEFISDFYDQRSYGGSVVATYPITFNQIIGVGWGYTSFKVEDVSPLLDPDSLSADRNVDLSAILLSWQFNNLDRPFRPTSGIRLQQGFRIGSEALGGNTEIIESITRFAWFIPSLGEQVLALRGGTTQVFPIGSTSTVPLPLRTWLGGAQNLRGFRYNSISTLNENGVPEGSESSWWAGVEYLVPVLPRADLALYTDIGDTSAKAGSFGGDGLVSDIGLGVLIRAENFPIRFDMAFPLSVREGDLENETGKPYFTFSAAYVF